MQEKQQDYPIKKSPKLTFDDFYEAIGSIAYFV